MILLNIHDNTGSLDVTAFGAQAIEILQMNAIACMEMHRAVRIFKSSKK